MARTKQSKAKRGESRKYRFQKSKVTQAASQYAFADASDSLSDALSEPPSVSESDVASEETFEGFSDDASEEAITVPDAAFTGLFRFLDLHPELRNFIYELVLQEEDTIFVDDNLTLTPILAVCVQIRDEAASIWYRDNTFTARIFNCQAETLNKWSKDCCTVGQRDYFDVGLIYRLNRPLDTENLIDWCKAIWKDDTARRLMLEDDMSDDEKMVCKAHDIAESYKGQSWDSCEDVLRDLMAGFIEVE